MSSVRLVGSFMAEAQEVLPGTDMLRKSQSEIAPGERSKQI